MNSALKESILLETGNRRRTNVFLEPLLLKAGSFMGDKIGAGSRSKYIRYALINQLIVDGYPLNSISDRYDPFYANINKLHRCMSTCT